MTSSTQIPARPTPPVDTPIGNAPAAHSGVWVPRFGFTERFAHWWTVSMVAVAVLTGLGLGDESQSGPMLITHIAAVISIGAGLLVAATIGDHRALLRAARRLFSFDRRDAAWVRDRLRAPWRKDVHREWGMFNTGQKFLAWAVTVSLAAVVVTGIQAIGAGDDGGGTHGAAVVVLMVLLGAHVFMAVVNPSTRPALAGMVFGRVRRSWAVTHHGAWLRHVDQTKR